MTYNVVMYGGVYRATRHNKTALMRISFVHTIYFWVELWIMNWFHLCKVHFCSSSGLELICWTLISNTLHTKLMIMTMLWLCCYLEIIPDIWFLFLLEWHGHMELTYVTKVWGKLNTRTHLKRIDIFYYRRLYLVVYDT